jgi:hypothetical protein
VPIKISWKCRAVTDGAGPSTPNSGQCCRLAAPGGPSPPQPSSRDRDSGNPVAGDDERDSPSIVVARLDRAIQQAAASRLNTAASGILGRPVIPDRVGDRRRAMTAGGFGVCVPDKCLSIQISSNDIFKYSFAIPRRDAPEVCVNFRATRIRGRGECRMRAAPAVPCAKWVRKRTRVYRFSGGNPTFPAQWF